MEFPTAVFQWLVNLNIMHDGYVVKKKKHVIVVNQQAANALYSGHIIYYVLHNIGYQNGIDITQNNPNSLTGAPGEEVPPQSAHYNWSIISDAFGIMGLDLSADHRQLIVSGDLPLTLQLLNDLYRRFSGDPQAAKNAPLAHEILGIASNREGAVSVDQGLDKLKAQSSSMSSYRFGGTGRKFSVTDDVERARQKYLNKLKRKDEEEQKKRREDERAEMLRLRIANSINVERFRSGLYQSHEVLPVYKEVSNRGVAKLCHELVEDIVESVVSGDAQAALEERERQRERARRAAEERRQRGIRLIDISSSCIHIPRSYNHHNALIVSDIVNYIVEQALRDDARKGLAEREAQRERDKQAVRSQIERNKKECQQLKGKKFEQKLKEQEEQAEVRRKNDDKKFATLRRLNEERTVKEKEKLESVRREKDIQKQMDQEKGKRREAELALYYAEQRAKVIEHHRQKKLEEEEVAKEKAVEDELARDERRRRGIDLNKKIAEKEMKRVKETAKQQEAPMSLSAYNVASGHHAAYYGDTLGWQYLTETEFDVAQLLCQVRSVPQSALPWIAQRKATIKGTSRMVWITDTNGKQHPMTTSEGRVVYDETEAFLHKLKPVKPLDDISIGLTLAARQHAADLAYHGVADGSRHVGSDGNTLSHRILHYGAPAIRPGSAELLFGVVRPANITFSPADFVTSLLLDDGNQGRHARQAIFDPTMCESAGVGHGVAEFNGGKHVVEVIVVIVAYSWIDKPVSWMSQAHHNALSVCAPPFLNNDRTTHPNIKSKKDLYVASNVCIGASTNAPNYEQLHKERLHKSKYANQPNSSNTNTNNSVGYDSAPPQSSSSPPPQRRQHQQQQQREEEEQQEEQQQQQSKPKKTKKKKQRNEASAHDDGATVDELAAHNSESGSLSAEEKREKYRVRLTRFYKKYAPHKVSIVDAALTMYEGKEEEMFFTLIRKYGPEPDENEDLDNPSNEDGGGNSSSVASGSMRKKKSSSMRKKSTSGENEQQKEEQEEQKEEAASAEKEQQQPKEENEEASPSQEEEERQEQQTQQAEEEREQKDEKPQDKQEETAKEEEKEEQQPARSPSKSLNRSSSTKSNSNNNNTNGVKSAGSKSKLERKQSTASNKDTATRRQSTTSAASDSKSPKKKGKAEEEKEDANSLKKSQSESAAPQQEEQQEQSAPSDATQEKKPEPTETEEASPNPEASEQAATPKKEEKGGEEAEKKQEEEDTSPQPAAPSPSSPSRRQSKASVKKDNDDENENEGNLQRESTVIDSPHEEPLPNSNQEIRALSHRTRLARIYAKFCPEKLPNVNRLMRQYKGKEDEVMSALVRKYGSEPDVNEDLDISPAGDPEEEQA